MLGRLFLLFTSMTLIEVYVLMSVGEIFGAELTIGLIILTAFLGSYLVRSQGLQTMKTLQSRMAAGEAPGQQIIEGMMLLMCGVLLVTPGFVTDTLGLLILTPGIRAKLAQAIMAKYKDRVIPQSSFTAQGSSFHFTSSGPGQSPFQGAQFNEPRQPGQKGTDGKGDIIDGDFVEMDDDRIEKK